ncbi:MAG: hypothetical protein AAF657_01415 [Acidobacteriota bacterium]
MLRFVVALEAEARPLIERFELQRDPSHTAFPVYRQDDAALVVCGIGKAAAAAATAYLHLATDSEAHALWLNVGIAGHGRREVGEAVLAHKICDRASGGTWYPPRVALPPCDSDLVTTVDQPELGYQAPGAFEMEAAAFYPTACRFTSAELVHCLKVVSDGPGETVERLTLPKITRLIGDHLPTVDAWLESCVPLGEELRRLHADPPDLDACLERWRFTVSERHELRRQLSRRQTLAPETELPLDEVRQTARGKEVNRRLRAWLDGLAAL